MAYDAFISYSHAADHDLAPAVRVGLQRLAKPWNRRRALSVFLDQASLELSSELSGSLDARIEDTRWLVLFLSEGSARSHWVAEEIREWADKKSKEQLALVLASGEVVWDNEAKDFDYERSTAVSEGMRGVYTGQESEPLFLDLTWTKEFPGGEASLDLNHPRFRDSIATLAAPIHGMPKDELEGEDVRQFHLAKRLRRAAISGLATLTVIAVIASILAWIQRSNAIRERDRARDFAVATLADTFLVSDPTTAAALLLEIKDPLQSPQAWRLAFAVLGRPIANAVLDDGDLRADRATFSPQGDRVLTLGAEGALRVAPLDGSASLRIEPQGGRGSSIVTAAFHPSDVGKVRFVSNAGGELSVWEADSEGACSRLLSEMDLGPPDAACTLSPDGARLSVLALAPPRLKVWQVGEPGHSLDDEHITASLEAPLGTVDIPDELLELAQGEDWIRESLEESATRQREINVRMAPDGTLASEVGGEGAPLLGGGEATAAQVGWHLIASDGTRVGPLPAMLQGDLNLLPNSVSFASGRVVQGFAPDFTEPRADGLAVLHGDGEARRLLHVPAAPFFTLSPDGERILTITQAPQDLPDPVEYEGFDESEPRGSQRDPRPEPRVRVEVWTVEQPFDPVSVARADPAPEFASSSPTRPRLEVEGLTLRVFTGDDDSSVVELRAEARIEECAASPDGRLVLTLDRTLRLQVWPADGSSRPITLQPPPFEELQFTGARFSDDGHHVLAHCLLDERVFRWTVSAEALWSALRNAEPALLSPEFRQQYLDESAGEALENFLEQQRQRRAWRSRE